MIEGADSLHATLRWENGGWTVYDDPAPKDTVVNGEAVRSRRLEPGDWLGIESVRILFDGTRLWKIAAGMPVGLRVTVLHATAETHKRSWKKCFRKETERHLDDVSFRTLPGKFVAILGPSGCGKTTLIQCMAGLAKYGGSIRYNGHEVREEKKLLLPQVAYLPQAVEDTFHGDTRVEDAVADFARTYLDGSSRKGWDPAEAFKQVGLDWKTQRGQAIRALSGGQKRRLALVLALQRNPQLLLLDEPTAGLDPAAEEGVMRTLKRLSEQGRTVFCATHVLGNLDLCDEVLVLGKGGRQAIHGTPEEALAHFGVAGTGAAGWLEVYRALKEGAWTPAEMEGSAENGEGWSASGGTGGGARASSGGGAGQAPGRGRMPHLRGERDGTNLPAPPGKVTFGAAFRGTFARLWREGWSSAMFWAVPPVVAWLLGWACGAMFNETNALGTICFCMAVAVFWMGLSGTVQALVAERTPKRCLDRMRGMPLTGYFAAHVAYAALSMAAKTLLFVAVVFGWRYSGDFHGGAAWVFGLVLWLTGFAGGCVGLFASACFRKELHAVLALPLVAICALFLSKPVLERNGKAPEGVLRTAECCAPTFHTQELLEMELKRCRVSNWWNTPENRQGYAEKWEWVLLTAAGYSLFLLAALGLQWVQERQWNGR